MTATSREAAGVAEAMCERRWAGGDCTWMTTRPEGAWYGVEEAVSEMMEEEES
jgi:hypothetical protein